MKHEISAATVFSGTGKLGGNEDVNLSTDV